MCTFGLKLDRRALLRTIETRPGQVHTAERVCSGQHHNVLIVEPHAVEDVPQVLRALGSVRQTAVFWMVRLIVGLCWCVRIAWRSDQCRTLTMNRRACACANVGISVEYPNDDTCCGDGGRGGTPPLPASRCRSIPMGRRMGEGAGEYRPLPCRRHGRKKCQSLDRQSPPLRTRLQRTKCPPSTRLG